MLATWEALRVVPIVRLVTIYTVVHVVLWPKDQSPSVEETVYEMILTSFVEPQDAIFSVLSCNACLPWGSCSCAAELR